MKYKYLLLMLVLFSLSLVPNITAIKWGENIVYDNFDDSDLNFSLWDNRTSGNSKLITDERNGFMIVNSSNRTTPLFGTAQSNSTKLPPINYLQNLSMQVKLFVSNSAGTSGENDAELLAFGSSIKKLELTSAVTSLRNNTVWTFHKNSSVGTTTFDIFSNTGFIKQITGINNNISVRAFMRIDGGEFRVSTVQMFYLNYSYSSETLNITINNPTETDLNNNIDFNITSTTAINNLKNATLFIDEILNETVSITGVLNETIFNKDIPTGIHNWSITVCDNDDNCKSSQTQRLIVALFKVNSETFVLNTLEGNSNLFQLNLTTVTGGSRLSTAKLYYNNTPTDGAVVDLGGNNFSVSLDFIALPVSSQTNYPFFWSLTFEDGSNINLTSKNQTVENQNIDDCTSFGNVILNYTLRDEKTQNLLTDNITIEVDVDIFAIGGSTPVIEFSQNYSINNPRVCLQNELNMSTFLVDVQTRYEAKDHVSEFHHIQSLLLTNVSEPSNINIDLFSLATVDSQEFLITFKSSSFLPVENALIDITRKYISEGVFKTVEVSKTDVDGQTLGHFELSEGIYTIIVKKAGVILATFDNVAVFCADQTIGNCEINLNAFTTGTQPSDFETIGGLSYTLTFDEILRKVTATFTTTNGLPQEVFLNVTKYGRFGNETVCTDTLTSSSGTLSCLIGGSFGNLTVIAELYNNGVLIITDYFTISQKIPDSIRNTSYVLVILLVMTLPLMAITSTIGVVLMIVFSLIISSLLFLLNGGSILGTGSFIVWIIIAAAILIYKIADRMK